MRGRQVEVAPFLTRNRAALAGALAVSAAAFALLPSIGAGAGAPKWTSLGHGISVLKTGSKYPVAPAIAAGSFTTGEPGDVMLSGKGFNKTGGPLLFNHQGGIATDGTRLALADRNNNRVLIWNHLPKSNVAPDLVLGQSTFQTNATGSGLGGLNWPIALAMAGGKLVVADAHNDRLLVWNTFPTSSGKPADFEISFTNDLGTGGFAGGLVWPWGVWTDGTKLAATSTFNGKIFLWNTFPTGNVLPDITLNQSGVIGTPRSITSNGTALIVGDHNAGPQNQGRGDHVWKTWPTQNGTPPDYFLAEPGQIPGTGHWMTGGFTSNGRLVMVGEKLLVWNGVPAGPNTPAAVTLTGGRSHLYFGGDGSAVAIAGNRLYVSVTNLNHILAFTSIPTSSSASPSFAVGSSGIKTNTLDTNFFITNPRPFVDGRHLIVSDGFTRRIAIWRKRPNASGAKPDLVYKFDVVAPQEVSRKGSTYIVTAKDRIYLWHDIAAGRSPYKTLSTIGGQRFTNILAGTADAQHFYLAANDHVYVWNGLPTAGAPAFSLSVPGVTTVSTDGTSLVATRTFGLGSQSPIWVYPVAGLSASTSHSEVGVGGFNGTFNQPQMVAVAHGALFVADTSSNRVLVWNHIADAVAGQHADAALGAPDLQPAKPSIARDRLYWPGWVALDGGYAWVGEFKFSGRLIRYSAH